MNSNKKTVDKVAKKYLLNARVFGKYKYLESSDKYNSWEDIFPLGKMVAVVTSDIGTYNLFEHYYYLVHEKIEIVKVLQASDYYIDKEVLGYKVINLKQLPDEYKDYLFVVFELDHYSDIVSQLKKCGINNYCSSFQLDNSKISKIAELRWKRKYGKKITSGMTYYYIRNRLQKGSSDTWKQFNKLAANRKIFIFGTGKGCANFLQSYYFKYPIEAAIDNDRNLWGSNTKGIPIMGVDCLKQYDPNQVLIIMTPIKCDNIISQLDELGYHLHFSYFEMESKRFIYKLFNPIRFYYVHKPFILFHFWQILPIDSKKIVCIRHNGKPFGCHEKYITLKLLERKTNCKIIWLVDDIYDTVPEGVDVVQNSLNNRIYQLATAKIWLDDGLKPAYTIKRKNQRFISTHHGTGITLKKFGLDERKDNKGTPDALAQFKRNDEISDLWLAASQTIANMYRSAFLYTGKVEITGSPRVDILVNNPRDIKGTIRKKLGLVNDEVFILYAPTFIRENSSEHGNKLKRLDLPRICAELTCFYKKEVKAGVRLHPMDSSWNKMDEASLLGDQIMNLTYYPDAQELLLAADILITDYSSIMFDMGYAMKKVILFVPELDEYVKGERDLFFKMEELPFSECKTCDEIIDSIIHLDEDGYLSALRMFNERCGILEDGNASDRVVDIIEGYLNE